MLYKGYQRNEAELRKSSMSKYAVIMQLTEIIYYI